MTLFWPLALVARATREMIPRAASPGFRFGGTGLTFSPPAIRARLPAAVSLKTRLKHLGGMNRRAAGEMLDLEPAREPRRNDDGVWPSLANRGQEALFAHEPRDLVMLGLVAERAGHAAAAGVEVDHLGSGERSQAA